MKKHFVIIVTLLFVACQDKEVQLNNEIKGTWQIDKIVYTSTRNGQDSAAGYQAKGTFTFEEYGSSRPSYVNYYLGDWSADCKTTYTFNKNNGQLFINPLVSPYADSDKVKISFTGQSTIDRLNEKMMVLNTTAVTTRSNASKFQAIKAKIFLSR